MDIEATLRDRFGLPDFRPGQREVIEALLAGRSAAAIFPTGGGKSLCYQLPALHMDGITVVVSPLIALMKDQIDALQRRGIPAARLDSSLSAIEHREVVDGVRDGTLRLLYVAPERFNNERFRALLRGCDIALLAVDEAHCISEWGHNFRPDYLKLARYAADFGAKRVLALTATATDRVLADIRRLFDIAEADAVRTPFYRENLTLQLQVVDAPTRDRLLLEHLQQRPRGPTVIYATLQKTAETLAQRLVAAGLPARHYHAGMESDARGAVQDWFMSSGDAIVVATIAFGMGIDKADIRYVYHYNPPKSPENYAQEIGRAGRDGQPATCQLYLCGDDLNPLENFTYGDTPAPEAVADLLDALFADPGEDLILDLLDLSNSTDIRPLVLRTLLTQLELEGLLEAGTPVYSRYSFKPLMSSKEILARFDDDRQAFLRGILASSVPKRVWFELDLDGAERRTGADRPRILRALDHLDEQGMIELRASHVRHRYRIVSVPPDRAALAARLYAGAIQREQAEIGRLHEIVALARSGECQVSQLGAHFGQPLDAPCGHCAACLGTGTPGATPAREDAVIDDAIADQLRGLRSDGKAAAALRSPRAVARLLCGVTSPRLSKARLTRHALFGRLSDVPFAEVLRWAEGAA